MRKKDSVVVPIIFSLSIIIPLAVAALMYLPEVLYIDVEGKLNFLPKVHAFLIGITAVLLFIGFILIKNKNGSNL